MARQAPADERREEALYRQRSPALHPGGRGCGRAEADAPAPPPAEPPRRQPRRRRPGPGAASVHPSGDDADGSRWTSSACSSRSARRRAPDRAGRGPEDEETPAPGPAGRARIIALLEILQRQDGGPPDARGGPGPRRPALRAAHGVRGARPVKPGAPRPSRSIASACVLAASPQCAAGRDKVIDVRAVRPPAGTASRRCGRVREGGAEGRPGGARAALREIRRCASSGTSGAWSRSRWRAWARGCAGWTRASGTAPRRTSARRSRSIPTCPTRTSRWPSAR